VNDSKIVEERVKWLDDSPGSGLVGVMGSAHMKADEVTR